MMPCSLEIAELGCEYDWGMPTPRYKASVLLQGYGEIAGRSEDRRIAELWQREYRKRPLTGRGRAHGEVRVLSRSLASAKHVMQLHTDWTGICPAIRPSHRLLVEARA